MTTSSPAPTVADRVRPSGWLSCPACGWLLYRKRLERNLSPIAPGSTPKPLSRSSSWMRWTCLRFNCVGSCLTRERCLTVSPMMWASPERRPPRRARQGA